MTGEMLSPPTGWAGLAWTDTVMTNLDHTFDDELAERLRDGGVYAYHAARDFQGKVWFADGRWHEQVSVHHVPQASFSADTLQELMKVVNDQFGWR